MWQVKPVVLVPATRSRLLLRPTLAAAESCGACSLRRTISSGRARFRKPRLQLVSQRQRPLVLLEFGSRRAKQRADAGRGAEDRRQNFALYNGRPEKMPIYLLVGAGTAQAAGVCADLHTERSLQAGARVCGWPGTSTQPGASPSPNHAPRRRVARLRARPGAGVNIFQPIGGGGINREGRRRLVRGKIPVRGRSSSSWCRRWPERRTGKHERDEVRLKGLDK